MESGFIHAPNVLIGGSVMLKVAGRDQEKSSGFPKSEPIRPQDDVVGGPGSSKLAAPEPAEETHQGLLLEIREVDHVGG